MSQTLQKVNLKVTNIETCQEKYNRTTRIFPANQLCAGGEKDKDSCNGDSGSSLMKLNKQNDSNVTTTDNLYYYSVVGIVSWGPEFCGTTNRPGVYTKVRAHIDWILKSLRTFSLNVSYYFLYEINVSKKLSIKYVLSP